MKTAHGSKTRGHLTRRALAEIQEKIGIVFRNEALLSEAFTHRSYLNELPREERDQLTHNEGLEFIGDAVLELAATDKLYRMFRGAPEGKLTAYRSALVNTKSLAETAARLNLDTFLLLSRGEARDTGRARQHILANTFEALVGAMYLDRGFGVATLFLDDVLFGKIDSIVTLRQYLDAKSLFQEMAQKRVAITPHYETLDETGPDHEKVFRVGVFLKERLIAEGSGYSTFEAEQQAASIALEKEFEIALKSSSL